MDNYTPSDEQRISKINPAGLINVLLLNIWQEFYRHIRKGEYIKANSDLDCLWVEFGSELKEKDNRTQIYKKIEEQIGQISKELPKQIIGFQTKSQTELENYAKFYRILLKKATFLKRLQNEQGKGTAYRDLDEDGFD